MTSAHCCCTPTHVALLITYSPFLYGIPSIGIIIPYATCFRLQFAEAASLRVEWGRDQPMYVSAHSSTPVASAAYVCIGFTEIRTTNRPHPLFSTVSF